MPINSNTELDDIIDKGKVSPSVAMVVFAVELKAQQGKIDALTQTINNDNARYATKENFVDVDKRMTRIENSLIGFVKAVLLGVLTVGGGVIIWAIQQGAVK